MIYHALITIVDDRYNKITKMVIKEDNQYELSPSNVIIHEFNIGSVRVPQGREMAQFIEEVKINENND